MKRVDLSKPERARLVAAIKQSGTPIRPLAKRFQISWQRVSEIAKEEGIELKRGKKL